MKSAWKLEQELRDARHLVDLFVLINVAAWLFVILEIIKYFYE